MLCTELQISMGDLLLRAIQQGNDKLFSNCVRHLQFDYKDYANSIGQTPLTVAAIHSRPCYIKVLLGLGADVNRPDGLDRTAALICAERGDLESLELLVNSGADILKVASSSKKAAEACQMLNRWRRRRDLCRVREALI